MRLAQLWTPVCLLILGGTLPLAGADEPTRGASQPSASRADNDDHVRHHASLGILMGSSDRGVSIVGIIPGSAAEQAGLRAGDVIRSVNDEPVRSTGELTAEIREQRPGTPINLTVRRGGQQRVVSVRLGTERSAGSGNRYQVNRVPASADAAPPARTPSRSAGSNGSDSQRIRQLQQQIAQLQAELNRVVANQNRDDSAQQDLQRPDWGWDGMDDKGRDPDILQ